MNISKRYLSSLVDSLRDFLKTFDKVIKCLQVPLPKPKLRLDQQNQKTIFLLITIKISLNIQEDKLDFLLRFVNNQFCVFSFKKFGLQCY